MLRTVLNGLGGLFFSPPQGKVNASCSADQTLITERFTQSPPSFRLLGPGGLSLNLCQEGQIVRLGRLPGQNDMALDSDDQISRQHALVRLLRGQVQVCDNQSLNGTRIDGRLLKRDPAAPDKPVWYRWRPGSTLRLGNTSLRLESLDNPLSLDSLKEASQSNHLESKEAYLQAINQAASLMRSTTGIVQLPQGVPTLVLPDLHAQRQDLVKALDTPIDGQPALTMLQQGRLNVVCLGDAMHGEKSRARWQRAEQDYLAGVPRSPAMEQEMVESFGIMKMIADLKSAFPENFHYLRGNHDELSNPHRPLLKYTDVGDALLVQHYARSHWGNDFIEQWTDFEKSMPLMCKGQGFVCSHAAPAARLDGRDIESRSDRAFEALTWTDNTGWKEDGVEVQLLRDNLIAAGADPRSIWLVGHRKVTQGDYRSQFDGQLIQINPRQGQVAALIPASGEFSPRRDVMRLS